uniref:Uncharacterized protein n=1 Tax=Arundo donax TaxID=35708 RepID=A0A0A9BIL8_ARUDO
MEVILITSSSLIGWAGINRFPTFCSSQELQSASSSSDASKRRLID